MTLQELKQSLNELAWHEQMDFEMSERRNDSGADEMEDTESKIRDLGKKLTTTLLDKLEQDQGYVVWALRLSPHVPGDTPVVRAQRLRNHPETNVRYWAGKIAQSNEPLK